MLAAPRFRLSMYFALILIAALTTKNWLLNKKIEESMVLLSGDTIAIQVHGVLPDLDTPTTEVEDSQGRREVVGWPISILYDGCTSLPAIGKIHLAGLTIEQARTAIANAYSGNGTELLAEDVEIQPLVKKTVAVASR